MQQTPNREFQQGTRCMCDETNWPILFYHFGHRIREVTLCMQSIYPKLARALHADWDSSVQHHVARQSWLYSGRDSNRHPHYTCHSIPGVRMRTFHQVSPLPCFRQDQRGRQLDLVKTLIPTVKSDFSGDQPAQLRDIFTFPLKL